MLVAMRAIKVDKAWFLNREATTSFSNSSIRWDVVVH